MYSKIAARASTRVAKVRSLKSSFLSVAQKLSFGALDTKPAAPSTWRVAATGADHAVLAEARSIIRGAQHVVVFSSFLLVMSSNLQKHGLDDGFELGVRLASTDSQTLAGLLRAWSDHAPWRLEVPASLGDLSGEIVPLPSASIPRKPDPTIRIKATETVNLDAVTAKSADRLDEAKLSEANLRQEVERRKLIRFLQDRRRRYRQVGGDKEMSVDVEVVCASNAPIADLAKRLAPDLFDRLSHLIVTVPPLRECREDLADDWARVWRELRVTTAVPSDPPQHRLLTEALASSPFPGNLRDLQRLAVLVTAWWHGRAEADAVSLAVSAWRDVGYPTTDATEISSWGDGTRRDRIRHFQRGLAQWAKERHGTWARAAKALGCDERTLREDVGE